MTLRDLSIGDTVKGDEDGLAGALDFRLIRHRQACRGRVRKSRLIFTKLRANDLLSAPDFFAIKERRLHQFPEEFRTGERLSFAETAAAT